MNIAALEIAGLLGEVVLQGKVDLKRTGGGDTGFDQLDSLRPKFSDDLGGGAVGSDAAVDGGKACDAKSRIDGAGESEIEMGNLDFRVERSDDGVAGVDGSGFAVELDSASAGECRGQGEGKGRVRRKILHLNVELIEDQRRSFGCRLCEDDAAIGNGDHLKGEVGRSGGRGMRGRGCGRGRFRADAGEIPDAGFVLDQIDLGLVDGDAGDMELVRENEWRKLDTGLERRGTDERGFAEGRVVGNGDIAGADGAGEQTELESAESDFTSEGCGQLGFEQRAKLVGVDEEGQSDDDGQ